MIQDLIKRNFWVFGALSIAVCAVFAAKTTSNIIEAKALNDSEKAPKAPAPSTTAPAPVAVKPVHGKDGTQLASRNMFCAECTPPVPDPTTTTPISSTSVVNTSLPLSLLATNVGAKPNDSYATIVNTETQHQGGFVIGDDAPATGAGKITAIHYKFIEFQNNGHTERAWLLGVAPPPVVAAVEPEKKDDENKDDMQVAVDNGVKKIDDNNYEIDRALVDKILANPMAVSKMARVVPSMKNGKPDGFKLYAIRPTSVYAKIGLQNGDTLNAINGMTLESADKALEVYTKLKDANALEAEITRRGKTMTMKYAIK